MRFSTLLRKGVLVRRFKRFLAEVEVEGIGRVTAHCPNPGAMTGLAERGQTIWLKPALPGRKLAWSWQLSDAGSSLVGVNTLLANHLAAEALENDALPALAGYRVARREPPLDGFGRADFLLEAPLAPPCVLEVKSVTLRRLDADARPWAEFPDSVTLRGARHMRALRALAASGRKAALLFVVQRGDCSAFRSADFIDPSYARALREAAAAGVPLLCHGCRVSRSGIELGREMALPLFV